MANKVVVKCDACETKNMVDPSRAQEARCGRCKNPLLDAFLEQHGEEGDDGLDFEGGEEEGEDDDDDHAGGGVRYPDITVELSGSDGNAFLVVGKVAEAMKRAGLREGVINEFQEEAMSGDYDKLLQTCMKWVNVE